MRPKAWLMLVIAAAIALIVGKLLWRQVDLTPVGEELIIFHAGSLSVPFREVSAEFGKLHPEITIKAEAAGSRACARKISDLGRQCDVMASADYKVVENLLMPDFADYNIRFALNEMVIAYTEESREGEKITADNWHEILLKKGIAFGRSDPNLDPCGYRTLMVFQLAQKYYEVDGLAAKLQAKDKHIRPKETDLLALLETGEIDYLFIYRSVATQHGLNMVSLPDEVNLKSSEFADLYGTAEVQLSGKKPGEFITRKGEPMMYSVTVCKKAPNPDAAQVWTAFLLSDKGREIMENNGQPCIVPPVVDGGDKLGDLLKQACQYSEN